MIRVGLPAAEVAAELVVEDAGADLEQEVGAVWFQRICCFDRALADDLVDRGLGGRGADGLPHLVPLSVPAFRDRQGPAGMTKAPAPCRGPHGHQASPPAGQLRRCRRGSTSRQEASTAAGRAAMVSAVAAVTAATAVVVVM